MSDDATDDLFKRVQEARQSMRGIGQAARPNPPEPPPPASACPCTSQIVGIYERRDQAAAEQLRPHIEACSSCRAEVQRLAELEGQQPAQDFSVGKELAKDLLVGLAAMGAYGLFLGLRGFGDIIRNGVEEKR